MPDFSWNKHVEVIVVTFSDVVLIVLVQHLPEHSAITKRLTANLKPQILRRLTLNLVDDADTKSNGA